MNDAQVERFLDRIDADRPPAPTVAALADLQLAHLLNVPFENLDIHRGVPIVLEPPRIYDKVVERRRGGYCYELNSNFGDLLRSLGFGVTLVSARVAGDDGAVGPEFDHLAVLVDAADAVGADDADDVGDADDADDVDDADDADDVDVPLLVDVGFGDAFTVPVPLVADTVRLDRDRRIRLTTDDVGDWRYEEDRGEGWRLAYTFTTVRRTLDEFAAMNEFQQRSPDSPFAQRTVCSLLTHDGRVTISGDRLVVTVDGERSEQTLAPSEIFRELGDRFGLDVRLAL